MKKKSNFDFEKQFWSIKSRTIMQKHSLFCLQINETIYFVSTWMENKNKPSQYPLFYSIDSDKEFFFYKINIKGRIKFMGIVHFLFKDINDNFKTDVSFLPYKKTLNNFNKPQVNKYLKYLCLMFKMNNAA